MKKRGRVTWSSLLFASLIITNALELIEWAGGRPHQHADWAPDWFGPALSALIVVMSGIAAWFEHRDGRVQAPQICATDPAALQPRRRESLGDARTDRKHDRPAR